MNDLKTVGSDGPTFKFIQSWASQTDCSTGVPCGVLRHFIHTLSEKPLHTPALNEREAVGIAAGMWLAGKKPLVYMQNSGMLVASNDIGSLLIPCGMDIPFLVTYRGAEGETAPQHFATGAATIPLLSAYGMWYGVLGEDNAETLYNECRAGMSATQKPGVILVKRGWTHSTGSVAEVAPSVTVAARAEGSISTLCESDTTLLREEALSAVYQAVPDDVGLISSTGLISRSLFARHHSQNQFYNAGGFGLNSAIGLGFAVYRPDRQIVVVEGDSSCLTNFGNLVSIGHYGPNNLVHVIIDNQSYGSCSEEPSISDSARFAESAVLMGYKNVYQVTTAQKLRWAVTHALAEKKLSLIHVKIKLGGDRNFARPLSMAQNAREFRTHMQ